MASRPPVPIALPLPRPARLGNHDREFGRCCYYRCHCCHWCLPAAMEEHSCRSRRSRPPFHSSLLSLLAAAAAATQTCDQLHQMTNPHPHRPHHPHHPCYTPSHPSQRWPREILLRLRVHLASRLLHFPQHPLRSFPLLLLLLLLLPLLFLLCLQRMCPQALRMLRSPLPPGPPLAAPWEAPL